MLDLRTLIPRSEFGNVYCHVITDLNLEIWISKKTHHNNTTEMETTSVCASQDGEANSKNADAVVETSDVTEVGITPQPQLANEAVTKVPSQEIPQDTKEHLPQASPALNLLENPTEKVDPAVEILDADLTHPAQDALASEHAHERSFEMEN